MKKTKILEKKYFVPISVIILALIMIGIYININQATKDIAPPNYPKQTKELCEVGDGQWKSFNTGCHDECWIIRSKEPVKCTMAFSNGCDCGPDKCWNGYSCESN